MHFYETDSDSDDRFHVTKVKYVITQHFKETGISSITYTL